MAKFTNPLDNIRIASPCKANWNEMYGDNRKRFCGECKLNVYNLSGMSRTEAEQLLLNSEGRLCVRFYRRNDGTVLTKDCPVGWQAIKRRISKISAAVFSMIVGIFGGIFAFNQLNSPRYAEMGEMTVERNKDKDVGNTNVSQKPEPNYTMGNYVTTGVLVNRSQVNSELRKNRK